MTPTSERWLSRFHLQFCASGKSAALSIRLTAGVIVEFVLIVSGTNKATIKVPQSQFQPRAKTFPGSPNPPR